MLPAPRSAPNPQPGGGARVCGRVPQPPCVTSRGSTDVRCFWDLIFTQNSDSVKNNRSATRRETQLATPALPTPPPQVKLSASDLIPAPSTVTSSSHFLELTYAPARLLTAGSRLLLSLTVFFPQRLQPATRLQFSPFILSSEP